MNAGIDIITNNITEESYETQLRLAGFACCVSIDPFTPYYDVSTWCRENIGEFNKDWFTWTGRRYWFKREEDAVLFALRWA